MAEIDLLWMKRGTPTPPTTWGPKKPAKKSGAKKTAPKKSAKPKGK